MKLLKEWCQECSMLYMYDVLQLVVDSLNDYPFVQQNLPLHAHEHVHYIITH